MPLSLLEVMTIAHAVCMWHKPKDVDGLIVIIPGDHGTTAMLAFKATLANCHSQEAPTAALSASFYGSWKDHWKELILLFIAPIIYGAPHLLGWNAVFPAVWERVLWHISSLRAVMGSVFATSFLLAVCGYSMHIIEYAES